MTTLNKKLGKLADEDPPFEVIKHPERWRETSAAPLLIVIHPGDALEFITDWSDREVGRGVVALSQANQAGMASEIKDKLQTHDALVLHRSSSTYLQAGGTHPEYRQAITDVERKGALLYGDDLDAAASWIIEHAKAAGAPAIHMTGAYADAESGCITAVGKAIQAAVPSVPITVSASSPTDNCNHAPRWNPAITPTKAPRP